MEDIFIDLPAETPALRYGSWVATTVNDPVVTFLVQEIWDQTEVPKSWEVARLSQAVYVYRETTTIHSPQIMTGRQFWSRRAFTKRSAPGISPATVGFPA
jgi:hypothetical protein